MSGWWSYSFCYGKEIVQFHALPTGLKSSEPPVRDPQSQEYVLGRVHYDTPGHKHQSQPNQRHGRDNAPPAEPDTPATTTPNTNNSPAPPNSELAVKDNQRYLVQRLDGGTLCDLTGRERTIEIQYHCHPGLPWDRIGWIKEVTTCTYLMVVQTPRLCADVAFLPPKEGRAHPVTCQPIADGKGDGESWSRITGMDGAESSRIAAADGQAAEVILSAAGAGKDGGAKQPAAGSAEHAGLTIGGVVVGGRAMLGNGDDGAPATRLPSPRHLGGGRSGGGTIVEILAKGTSKAEGGKVEVLTREELEMLDLSPEAIEDLRRELQKLAGDNGWKLEVVEVPGEIPEIRGIVEEDDDDEAEKPAKKQPKKAKEKVKEEDWKVFRAETKKKQKGSGKDRPKQGDGKQKDKAQDSDDEEGSTEKFYRDEL
jgi:protein OS-9